MILQGYHGGTRTRAVQSSKVCFVVQLQPVAAGLDISDPAANDRKIRIVVVEGRNREVGLTRAPARCSVFSMASEYAETPAL